MEDLYFLIINKLLILILNFRENFTLEDNTLLIPELVISLGDINNIEVIPAFNNIIVKEKSKG